METKQQTDAPPQEIATVERVVMEKVPVPELTAEWYNETIKFRWTKVEGTKTYVLRIRNVANRDKVMQTEMSSFKSSLDVKMAEQLKYGETCEVMLRVVRLACDEIETDWKRFIIGGSEVPRNLKAVVNFDDPQRSVKISWDAPEENPTLYEVVSIPQTGKRLSASCTETTFTFHRLKRATRYQFMVLAVYITSYQKRKSFGCKTNFITTYTKANTMPTVQYSSLTGAKLNLMNAALSINNQPNTVKQTTEIADKPRNLEMVMTTEEGDLEMGQIFWEEPTFSRNAYDYQIMQYEVIVQENKKKLPYSPVFGATAEHTEKFIINLGKRYSITLKTTYEELDTEKVTVSELKEDFYSRPSTPKVQFKDGKNNVTVAWQSAMGATQYKVEVSDSSTGTLLLAEEGGKVFLSKALGIGKQVFRGRYYIATVTATGKSNRTSAASITMFVGGDRMPRMPKAALSKDQPSNSVILEWEAPFEENPLYYVAEVDGNSDHSVTSQKTTCVIQDLAPGTKYNFLISAVYAGKKEDTGCCTDEITTDSSATVVSGIKVKTHPDHPDTSLLVQWDELDGAASYKVSTKAKDFLQEQITTENKLQISGLQSNTKYEVSISAASGDEYGSTSTKVCSTDIAPPRDMKISCESCSCVRVDFLGSTESDAAYNAALHDENDELVEEKLTTKCSCQFENLSGNTKYFVKVKSVDGNKMSHEVASAAVLTLPASIDISELKLSDSDPTMDIDISWEDGKCDLYEIEVSTDGEVERKFLVEKSTSCKYRCLQRGKAYQVRLRSKNPSGYSTWSSQQDIILDDSSQAS